MATKIIVTFKGTGQLNGSIIINKTIEFERNAGIVFTGSKRNDAILSTLAVHYPGVKIDPKRIGLEIKTIESN